MFWFYICVSQKYIPLCTVSQQQLQSQAAGAIDVGNKYRKLETLAAQPAIEVAFHRYFLLIFPRINYLAGQATSHSPKAYIFQIEYLIKGLKSTGLIALVEAGFNDAWTTTNALDPCVEARQDE